MEFERHFFAVFDHVKNTVGTEHIRNFMRVGYRRDRTVNDRQSGKFRRDEHRTFDVDVRIDKTRQKVCFFCMRFCYNCCNFTVIDGNFARKNTAVPDVYDLPLDFHKD